MLEMTLLCAWHKGSDGRKRYPSPNLKKEATDAHFLSQTFTLSAEDLQKEHLQRDSLKYISSRLRNNFKCMKSPKGAKQYLVVITVEGRLLTRKNQKIW